MPSFGWEHRIEWERRIERAAGGTGTAALHVLPAGEHGGRRSSPGRSFMANDVKLVRLYVSSVINGTLDDTPNEVGGNPNSPFYLMVEANASDPAGDNKINYTLVISAHSTSGNTTTFAARVLNEQAGVPGDGWRQVTAGGNDGYIKQSNYAINATDFQANGLYEFVATLRLGDGSVSTVRSNEFFIS